MVLSYRFIAPIGIFLILFAVAGCDSFGVDEQNSDAPLSYAPDPKSGTSKSLKEDGSEPGRIGPFEKKFDGITFEVPTGWRDVPLSGDQMGFIDARFEVSVSGRTLKLTCSSTGGGIDANVQRWIGQFQSTSDQPPIIEPINIDGVDATWVDLQGTFNSAVRSAQDHNQDWRMLGVGIPMQPRDFYLKLTGPADSVEEVLAEFRKFAKSARIDD